jgi:NAD(P)-dependent dehydrogenase (short-subunit alcohol dehydrogenase family)
MKSFLAGALIAIAVFAAGAADAATVLITGANRGLGLEFARQYAMRGYTVIATARKPAEAQALQDLAKKYAPNIEVERLDVLDAASVTALAAKYKGKSIDILLNNAGIHGDIKAQTFGSLDLATFNQVMDTNLFGALFVTQAFIENVKASKEKKVIGLTSPAGSFKPRPPRVPPQGKESLPAERAVNTGVGSQLFYGASKVAMNLTWRRLGGQFRKDGVIFGLIAPYTVETDMLREVGYQLPATSLIDGVAGLIKAVDKMTLENTSKPIGDDGFEMEW